MTRCTHCYYGWGMKEKSWLYELEDGRPCPDAEQIGKKTAGSEVD